MMTMMISIVMIADQPGEVVEVEAVEGVVVEAEGGEVELHANRSPRHLQLKREEDPKRQMTNQMMMQREREGE